MPILPVIVVGAGVAGIRAAQLLQRRGINTIILEAKATVGGRMCSIPYHGTWLEMGASWLHGYGQHPFRQQVQRLGLRTAFTDYNGAHTLPGVGPGAAWHNHLQAAVKRAAKQPKDAPLQDFLREVPSNLQPIITMETEMYYGATLAKLSGWNFDEGGEPEPDDHLLLGGWANWLQHQAKGMNIQLNTQVTAVTVRGKTLTVQTAAGKEIPACAVIHTLPLGVLQQPGSEALLPDLPRHHTVAIQRLGMGNLEKLFFTAPVPSWPRHDVLIANHPLLPLWYDVTPMLGTPMLMGLAGMSALAALPPKPTATDWLALATPALRQLIPQGPLPTLVAHSAWHDDPFSQGSYSYYAVGSSPADRRTLQKPWLNGRLWLAGEHTDVAFPANIQGAWRSGERVARALIKAL